jgi:hypothetical protein
LAEQVLLVTERTRRETTIVVGVDGRTFHQLEAVLSAWLYHWPELATNHPWCVFYDWQGPFGPDDIKGLLPRIPHGLKCVSWPTGLGQHYKSQRERMLSGYAYVPQEWVGTKWWMKIDTDAYPVRRDPKSWQLEWFESESVYVANPWSYTKAKGDDRNAYEWAEALESFGDRAFPETERLGLKDCINEKGNKIFMPRMASWVSLYRSAWTREMASRAFDFCGPYRLPVPSQDTFHWYCAARQQAATTHFRFKRGGWTNKTAEPAKLRQLSQENVK